MSLHGGNVRKAGTYVREELPFELNGRTPSNDISPTLCNIRQFYLMSYAFCRFLENIVDNGEPRGIFQPVM